MRHSPSSSSSCSTARTVSWCPDVALGWKGSVAGAGLTWKVVPKVPKGTPTLSLQMSVLVAGSSLCSISFSWTLKPSVVAGSDFLRSLILLFKAVVVAVCSESRPRISSILGSSSWWKQSVSFPGKKAFSLGINPPTYLMKMLWRRIRENWSLSKLNFLSPPFSKPDAAKTWFGGNEISWCPFPVKKLDKLVAEDSFDVKSTISMELLIFPSFDELSLKFELSDPTKCRNWLVPPTEDREGRMKESSWGIPVRIPSVKLSSRSSRHEKSLDQCN